MSAECRCICHDGYSGAHPNEKCLCNGGPACEWIDAEAFRSEFPTWVVAPPTGSPT